jgi:hypothetical protein
MQGALRVITTSASKKSHRLVVMRQAPSPLMIADLVGGEMKIVEGFDSILHGGEAVPCKVFCSEHHDQLSPNAFANLGSWQRIPTNVR